MGLRIFLILCLTAAGSLRSEICEKPKVFIDCANCDMDFIRTEITFVNYVIERQAADVFIMITSQGTGGGGDKYTIEFTGKGKYENIIDTLRFDTSKDDTSDLIRNKVVRSLKMGLIRYISGTPLSDRISISYLEDTERNEVKDEWDSWVYTLTFDSYLNGEKSYNSANLYGGIYANRITDNWKFNSSVFVSYYEKKSDYSYLNTDSVDFSYLNDETYTRSQSCYALLVKSLDDHWSAGMSASGNISVYSNYKYSVSAYPAVEYNIFPYSESTSKMFRILYKLGYKYSKYNEITIYDKDDDGLFVQSLSLNTTVKQPWGQIEGSLTGSNYFYEGFNLDKNRFDVNLAMAFNIVSGLSLNVSGWYSVINDQINLSKENMSDFDIMLQKKQMATSYSYWSSIGFSYTFGSIYNNVVNPRFGN